ncbi:mitogen-activated protein kinase kinase kinase 3-like isoform X2 [Babylonia areolata]|uniref:mitogen-activated protein kinase kinase kinase 3-like isoform X2 n=1 Tax=Babylonia areolata TaxID=304850 RepID=UPI003FD085D3
MRKTTSTVLMSLSSSSSSSSCSVALSGVNFVSTSVRESHLELLINISQCSDSKCSDITCLKKLEAALRKGLSHVDKEHLVTLRYLHEHYTFPCCSPNCQVPWCRYMSYRCLQSQEHTLQELMTVLNDPMLTLLPQGTQFEEVIQLDPGISCKVVEWEHWLMLFPLSLSHTVALAAPLEPDTQSMRWVVKMVSLRDDDNQLCMLKKLRGLRHPHMVSHIWAASSDTHQLLAICSEYLPGRSVREKLEESGQLTDSQTRFYFLQVLYAAHRLHQLNIVFLNWRCSNLLLDVGDQMLKVSNFSTAVDLSRDNADMGTIKLTLPADIVPVELCRNESLSLRSDSWGLACLVHEMLTGTPPWHHLRHDNQQHVWKQIQEQTPPDVSTHLPDCVHHLTHTCLQESQESRLSVMEMMDHLHAHLD